VCIYVVTVNVIRIHIKDGLLWPSHLTYFHLHSHSLCEKVIYESRPFVPFSTSNTPTPTITSTYTSLYQP
jgi:hypothetical protein